MTPPLPTAILAAETALARECVLAVTVRTAKPVWQTAIPGMFLVDFIARTGAIRRFLKIYLAPRHLAWEVACDDRDETVQARRVLAGLQAILPANADDALGQAWADLVSMLAAHYQRLPREQAVDYHDMLRTAHPEPEARREWLDAMNRCEHRALSLLAESRPDAGSARRLVQVADELVARRRRRMGHPDDT